MKNIKRPEDFETKFDFIQYLKDNKLVYDGCCRCMAEYGICDNAIAFFDARESTTDCSPFGDYQETLYFPNRCLKDWGSPCCECD